MFLTFGDLCPSYYQVIDLFHDHNDLLVEFGHFLPDTSSTASLRYAPLGKIPIPRRDDRSSPMTTIRPMHVEKVVSVLLGTVVSGYLYVLKLTFLFTALLPEAYCLIC